MAAAFISYVREVDANGDVTRFRQALEKAVREHGWEDFRIFQDLRDIEWGDDWQAKVIESLDDVALLMPIVSPGFIKSPSCEFEVNAFLKKERSNNRLGGTTILPVHFVTTSELEENPQAEKEWMRRLRDRTFLDFRVLRILPEADPKYREKINSAAERIDKLLRKYESSFVPVPGGPAPPVPLDPVRQPEPRSNGDGESYRSRGRTWLFLGALAAVAAGAAAALTYRLSPPDAAPSDPGWTVEPLDEACVVRSSTQARQGPNEHAARAVTLAAGEEIRLVGRVRNAPWLAAVDKNGSTMYLPQAACGR